MALNWKGGWTSDLGVSDMTYYKDDVVDHNNVMYIVTANSVPIGSPAPGLDMSKWDTVVSGAIGTSGSSGTSGTSGSTPIGLAKVYTSGTAGTSWTFTHNLGTLNPIVQVWGTNGKVVIPEEIVSVDANTIKIEFPELVAGKATIGNGYSGTSGTSGTRGTSGTSGTGFPGGGTSGQTLIKNSTTSGDASWVNYIPTGGTSGQLLSKVDGDDYNTEWIDPFNVPTVIFARNTSGQTISNNVIPTTVITNWTNVIRQNGAEWDQATGLFTATKSGTYQVSAAMAYSAFAGTVGSQYNISIVKNGVDQSILLNFVQNTASTIKTVGPVTAIVSVVPGDVISIRVYHVTGGNRTLSDAPAGSGAQNNISIQEIPGKIKRN